MSSTFVTVTNLVGQAWYRDTNGNLINLQVGMQIPADAQVVTAANSAVTLQAMDQPAFSIGADQSIALSPDLVEPPDASEASIAQPEAGEVDAIIAAINAGEDPFDNADPTAATLTGDGGAGSSFTRLSSILEYTTPLALEYPGRGGPGDSTRWYQGGMQENLPPELLGSAPALVHEDSDLITAIDMAVYFRDPEGQTLTYSATQLPLGLSINPITGVISGTLDSSASQGGNNGIHQVVVTATDPAGNSTSLSFLWTVTNPPPEADDDNASVVENVLLNVGAAQGLLSNDTDRDGDDLAVVQVRNASGNVATAGAALAGSNGGLLTVQADGSYVFTQGTDFDDLAVGHTRDVVFTYTISDGDGGFDTAQLVITVTGTNDAPVARADSNEVKESGIVQSQGQWVPEPGTLTATGNVLTNDTDVDDGETIQLEVTGVIQGGQTIAVGTVVQGTYGSLVVNGDGTYTYTLNDSSPQVQALIQGQVELDTFTYEISDPQGATATAVLTIQVNGTNDPPVAVNDTGSVTEAGVVVGGNTPEPGTPTSTGNVLDNDSDVDAGETIALKVVGFYSGTSAAAAVTTAGQSFSNAYGTLTISEDGRYTYTLNNNSLEVNQLAVGEPHQEVFTYIVTDTPGAQRTATLTITITGTNDIPVIDASTFSSWDTEVRESGHNQVGDSTATGALVANDVDNNAQLTWKFHDPAGAGAGTPNATVTNATVLQGTYGQIELKQGPGGTWSWEYTLDQNRAETQALNEGLVRYETFHARVLDEHGAWADAEIKVKVTGSNDAPVAVDDTGSVTEAGVAVGGNTPEPGAPTSTGNVLDDDSDVDAGETIALKVVGFYSGTNASAVVTTAGQNFTNAYGTLTIKVDGSYTYTLNNNSLEVNQLAVGEPHQEVFTYIVTDTPGAQRTATLTITITGTNDQPVVDIAAHANWDIQVTESNNGVGGDDTASGTLVATDVDSDGGTLTWGFVVNGVVQSVLEMQGEFGKITLNPTTGAWVYTLDQSKAATQSLVNGDRPEEVFDVRVTDIHGAYAETTIKVTVIGTNDTPIAVVDADTLRESGVQVGGNSAMAGKALAEGNVLDNDTDLDHTQAQWEVTGLFRPSSTTLLPAGTAITTMYGKLLMHPNGTYVYELDNSLPAVNQLAHGVPVQDVFTYQVRDLQGGTSTATLTFTITGTNDIPVIDTSTFSNWDTEVRESGYNQAGDSIATGALVANDVDNGATLTWKFHNPAVAGTGTPNAAVTNATVLQGTYGQIELKQGPGGTWSWQYTLDQSLAVTQALKDGDVHYETFHARVLDEHGAWADAEIKVKVTGSNDAPVATNDTVYLYEDATNFTGNLITGEISGSHVNQQLSSGGADDNHGEGDLTVVAFRVQGMAGSFTPADTPLQIPGANGSMLGVLTIASNGAYSFVPSPDFSGSLPTITYTVQEPIGGGESGLTATAELQIHVIPVADAPALVNPSDVTAMEDPIVNTPATPSIALGLMVPEAQDQMDFNGQVAGDNPERLGVISLTFTGGAFTSANPGYLHLPGMDVSLTQSGQVVKILIVGGDFAHTNEALAEPGVHLLTQSEFQALTITPAQHRHENIRVDMQVTSYEVDAAGNRLQGIDGASSTVDVTIDVQAVTDDVTLTWSDGTDQPKTMAGNEDIYFNLTPHLKAAFQDLDGSELRWFTIFNGSDTNITVQAGGQTWTVLAGAESPKINSTSLSSSAGTLPGIQIKATAQHYSGNLNGLEVRLHAQDRDDDSAHATQQVTDQLVFNLDVNPVVDGLAIAPQSMQEDSTVMLNNALRVTMPDNDGSQSITQFVIQGFAAGWTVSYEGNVITSATGSYDIMGRAGASNWTQAQLQAELAKYTVTPPAQSSLDARLQVTWTVQDSQYPNATTAPDFVEQTRTVSVVLPVTPVAEFVGGPGTGNDGNLNNDLTMTPGFNYANSPQGLEDEWFALNVTGFDLRTGWNNPDGSGHAGQGTERTWALLTPVLLSGTGASGDTATGASFSYTGPNGTVTLVYNGSTPVRVPMEYLNTLQFKGPPDVAATFRIKVNALTQDFDEDTGVATAERTSGEAWLDNIVMAPQLDGLDNLVANQASGKEDTQIPLKIHPTSTDPSETFNVKIDAIPQDAVLTYNGQQIAVGTTGVTGLTVVDNGNGSWSVVIENFDHSKPLTILPTPQSNVDFTLKVSVDVFDGPLHTGFSAPKDLKVDLTGVADPVSLTSSNLTVTEAATDSAGGRISLNDAFGQVTRIDNDGSETLNFRITGLPPGFTLDGGIPVAGGTGTERAWLVTSETALRALHIIAPEHFSGTVPITVIPVTTENDGNWLMSPPVPINITVTPSPESKLDDRSVVLEEQTQSVIFKIGSSFTDGKESLTDVWIKAADITGKQFELLFKGEPFVDSTDLSVINGYYHLTGADIGEVTARALDPEFAHETTTGSFHFEVKYQILNHSTDGTVGSVSEVVTMEEYKLHIQPVTDPVQVIGGVELHDAPPHITLHGGNEVRITDLGTFAIAYDLNKSDQDGSEQLTQLEVSGIPDGLIIDGLRVNDVTVGSVSFIGNGKWLITVDTSHSSFSGPDLRTEVLFRAGELLAGHQKLPITISNVTNDPGAANTQSANVTWQLTSFMAGNGNAPTPNVIHMTWGEDPTFSGTEDTAFTMDQAFNVGMVVSHPDQNVHFTLKLTMQEGAVVLYQGQPIKPTTIAGDNGEALEVFVITDYGTEADMQAMLAAVHVTPPPNVNDNFGGMTYDATMTAYHTETGSQSQKILEDESVSLTPVTDPDSGLVVELHKAGTTDAPQEGSPVDIRIQIGNGVDGGSELGDTLYVQLTESARLQGGTVYDSNNNPLAVTTLAAGNAMGLPPGDYYLLPLANTQIPQGVTEQITLRYEPAPGSTYTSGSIEVKTWVEKKEANDPNGFHVAEGGAQAPLTGVNNGFDVDLPPELQGTERPEGSRIQLNLTGGLRDAQDGSEEVILALLKNVPQGFLVYMGATAADAVAAGNAGTGDDGGATWTIPVGPDGKLPAYIAIQPPSYWSGTVADLEFSVLSGEVGKAPSEDSVTFSIKVDPKVNGIVTPVAPEISFGTEGQLIALNLNINMRDDKPIVPDSTNPLSHQDSSVELLKVEIQGLGAHAGFFTNGVALPMDGADRGFSYDAATATYTLYGLTQQDVDGLQLLQSATTPAGQPVSFTAWTYETANPQELSDPVQGSFNLTISAQPATTAGNDTILFNGVTAIDGKNGNDTVVLRHSEDLDFATAGTTAKFKNIEVLDLETSGADHQLSNVSASAVQAMTDTRNTLMIKADAGDHISLLSEDNWVLNIGQSTAEYNVYTSGAATLHISKDASVVQSNDMLGSMSMRMMSAPMSAEPLAYDDVVGADADNTQLSLDAHLPPASSAASSPSADAWSSNEADVELQNKLAQQLLNQGKSVQDHS